MKVTVSSVPVGPISAIRQQLASSRLAVTNNALYNAISAVITNMEATANSVNQAVDAINQIAASLP